MDGQRRDEHGKRWLGSTIRVDDTAVSPAAERPPAKALVEATTPAQPREGFLTGAFLWMFVALLLSAAAAFVTMSSPALQAVLAEVWLALLIGQVVLVIGIGAVIGRMSASLALGLFFVYALSMGLVLGVIVEAFVEAGAMSGVVTAFLGASAVFAGAAVYGSVTKRDLTSLGGILLMGLIGLIAVMVARLLLFPGDTMLSLGIGFLGVAIFTGLTAYDVQRLKEGTYPGISAESASVIGALALYLDFVNLFLHILSFFGEE